MRRRSQREPLVLVWLWDLQLLGYFYLARLTVWRELRREQKAIRNSRVKK